MSSENPDNRRADIAEKLTWVGDLNLGGGSPRYLGDGLAELRWKSGTRVYFSRIEDPQGKAVLLILGGTKHGQDKDISNARVLLRRYAVETT